MAISTYMELTEAVSRWMHRADLVPLVGDFVMLAESRINDVLRHPMMEKRASAVAESEWLAIPDDMLEVRHFEADGKRLESLAVDQIEVNYDHVGEPQFYAVIDAQFRILPFPERDASVEILYYAAVPSLSNESPANWLLTRNPNVYLYAALLEACIYADDDAKAQKYQQLFTESIAAAMESGAKLRHGESIVLSVSGVM